MSDETKTGKLFIRFLNTEIRDRETFESFWADEFLPWLEARRRDIGIKDREIPPALLEAVPFRKPGPVLGIVTPREILFAKNIQDDIQSTQDLIRSVIETIKEKDEEEILEERLNEILEKRDKLHRYLEVRWMDRNPQAVIVATPSEGTGMVASHHIAPYVCDDFIEYIMSKQGDLEDRANRILVCDQCKRYFIPEKLHKNRFCSGTCRDRWHNRQSERKKRKQDQTKKRREEGDIRYIS